MAKGNAVIVSKILKEKRDEATVLNLENISFKHDGNNHNILIQ